MTSKQDKQLPYAIGAAVILIGVLYLLSTHLPGSANDSNVKTVELTPVAAENPAGEADTGKMYLGMKTWNFIKAKGADGKVTTPTTDKPFTLAFDFQTGKFSATTDCNPLNGFFAAKSGVIAFGAITSGDTQCTGALEGAFNNLLSTSNRFYFTSKGEMVLTTKDGGTVTFR